MCSGLPTDQFLYLGYLPRKAGDRRSFIAEVAAYPYTLIVLESPHRLAAALEDLQAVLGDRQAAVAGELTKMYEDIFRGQLSTAQEYIAQHPARGEYTLVVAGASKQIESWEEGQVLSAIQTRLAAGDRPAEIARQLAAQSGWPRRKIYALLTGREQEE